MTDKKPLLGVIDVGTNTCHMLIARFREDGELETIHRERRFVKLAENGIESIKPAAMERGLKAIRDYTLALRAFKVTHIRVIGTAALRTAANGPEFMRKVKEETGLDIATVTGDKEAELIHRGVSMAVDFDTSIRLIIDIGGGSVECILANEENVFWAQSFPVGLAVLFHHFHRHDPMTAEDVQNMENWLSLEMAPLDEALKAYPPVDMVGASGTFDILADLLHAQKLSEKSSRFTLPALQAYSKPLMASTISERLAMTNLTNDRADMFMLAIMLLEHLARRANVHIITTSNYAMKEGILAEMGEKT